MSRWSIVKLTDHGAIADRRAITVVATWDDDDGCVTTFTGPATGTGPVVMVTDNGRGQTFVTDPARFGPFGPEWVRRFYTH